MAKEEALLEDWLELESGHGARTLTMLARGKEVEKSFPMVPPNPLKYLLISFVQRSIEELRRIEQEATGRGFPNIAQRARQTYQTYETRLREVS